MKWGIRCTYEIRTSVWCIHQRVVYAYTGQVNKPQKMSWVGNYERRRYSPQPINGFGERCNCEAELTQHQQWPAKSNFGKYLASSLQLRWLKIFIAFGN